MWHIFLQKWPPYMPSCQGHVTTFKLILSYNPCRFHPVSSSHYTVSRQILSGIREVHSDLWTPSIISESADHTMSLGSTMRFWDQQNNSASPITSGRQLIMPRFLRFTTTADMIGLANWILASWSHKLYTINISINALPIKMLYQVILNIQTI